MKAIRAIDYKDAKLIVDAVPLDLKQLLKWVTQIVVVAAKI